MPERKAKHSRRWLFALLALLPLGGGAAFALRHYTRPDKLTALLVEQARSALGADLTTEGAASFGFVPKLSVTMPHPVLKARGANITLMSADALRAVVPWHTLWADRYDIERIALVKPNLDLDALRTWLAARPASGAAPPDVRFALHVEDGTITSAGKPVAQGVNMELASGGDLAAWLATIGSAAAATPLIPPLDGSADTAALQMGGTRLEHVHIEVQGDDATPKPSQQP